MCILFANDLYPDQPIEPCDSYAIMHDFMHQHCQCQAGTSVTITQASN